MDLKLGDTVTLVSGGLPMTVECLFVNSDKVKCVWFTTKGEIKRDLFDSYTLRVISGN